MKTRKIASITAAVAVVLAMIGAGVYASWSENATASQNLEVGTFSMKIVAATDGAVIATDGKSVTYAVPEIRDSAAATAPFSFTVQSFGEIPIRVDANETTAPAAPFYGLPVVPDGDTVLHEGEQVVFTAGIGWPELGWDELGDSTSVTYAISGTEGDPRGTAIAPTAVEKSCYANDGGINIPDVEGVDYFLPFFPDPTSPGFHQRDMGTYQVTAQAQPGFDSVLLGYPAGGWTIQVVEEPGCIHFDLEGFSLYSGGGTPAGYPTAAPPVIDNIAQTITWTQSVNGAANPMYTPPLWSSQPNVLLGRFSVSGFPVGTDFHYVASATVSPSLAGQESKFRLAFQSGTYNNPVVNISSPATLLPVSAFDLEGPTSLWDEATGGHTANNGVAVLWSGVTGTGFVTITLTIRTA